MLDLDEIEQSAREGIAANPAVVLELVRRLREMAASRERVLRGLIDSRQSLRLANETPNGPICDTIWMLRGNETLFDFMDAAVETEIGPFDRATMGEPK